MDSGRTGSESQDSDDPAPSGSVEGGQAKSSTSTNDKNPVPTKPRTTSKGIQNAKKRLRAFSIQKKTPLTPITVPKTVSTGNATVLIGKLSSVKSTPKPEKVEDDVKKPPKPPKPGASKKLLQESYTELQKQTISEIEDMKRKMELVDLGIPLGLICPNTNEKAMPTKAMPPIKTFLDTAKVDELICEAKKARAEGKEFKFDYKKLLPDYDNPFQRKKEDPEKDNKEEQWKAPEKEKKYTEKLGEKYDYTKEKEAFREKQKERSRERKNRDPDDRERHDKHKGRDKYSDDRYKDRGDKMERGDKSKERETRKDDSKKKDKTTREHSLDRDTKEADVNLNDYLVCDSWSLDTNSPQLDDKSNKKNKDKSVDPMTQLKESLKHRDGSRSSSSPQDKLKIEKLKPVNDSFKYEIDPNDDEVLDVLDGDNEMEAYTKVSSKNSPANVKYGSKDTSMDGMNEDNFLESVINEIKQENMSDEDSQDKGLVEYDSPVKDDNFKLNQGSRTPELNTSSRGTDSQRSDYSDGYKSTESRKSVDSYKSSDSGIKSTDSGYYKSAESGRKSVEGSYRSTESGYRSTESGYRSTEISKSRESGYKGTDSDFKAIESAYKSGRSADTRSSIERELDEDMALKMPQWTVDSLETWSFVLKICQPLLFRHDKNKCYKETRVTPKVWYTMNPKLCNCVKDRSVVYEELEMCKMGLVDHLYSSEGPSDNPPSSARSWYPRLENCLVENLTVPMSSEWDLEAGQEAESSHTPDRSEEEELDREYQKFMQALWPEVADIQAETGGSTTPVKKESRKKKKTEEDTEETKKSAKKIKLSSKSWSQESEVEEEVEKIKKPKEKLRKRKRSSSPLTSDGESEGTKKKKKKAKKKSNKKFKIKEAKNRKLAKKLQKLKDRKKKKKTEDSELEEEIETKKKDKKLKKKKFQKNKKKSAKKKKKKVSTSSSSTSSSSESSSSDTDMEIKKKKKKKKKGDEAKKKKKDKKKKRKQSTSDSTQSEDLFDVNILNNIKTERIEDDSQHKMQPDFSPRHQKPKENREIISVKELHQDFSNHIQVKQEKETDGRNEAAAEKVTSEQTKSDTTVTEKPTEISPEKKIAENKKEADKSPVEKVQVEKTVEQNVGEKMKIFDLGEDERVAETVDNKLRQEHQPTAVPQPETPLNPNTPQPIKPVTNTPRPIAPVTNTPQPIVPVTNTPRPIVPVTSTPQPIVPVINIPQPIVPVTNTPRPIVPVTNTPQPIVPVINTPRPIVPVTNTHQPIVPVTNTHQPIVPVTNTPQPIVPVTNATHPGYEAMETDDNVDNYEQGNYEMYEQMAMQYQSDVANQLPESSPQLGGSMRIETVVRSRPRGEIKCDWRAGDTPQTSAAQPPARPSRWGLKPGEVNIVLTGADPSPEHADKNVVFSIQSLANRHHDSKPVAPTGYDEAYMATYGVSDRLQYGDCFAATSEQTDIDTISEEKRTSLDQRISRALRDTVLGEVAREAAEESKEPPEKGILASKTVTVETSRGTKRVSFADGYKPGQDSDVEEPPVKKKKKRRRYGCAWPCPLEHPDHVSLWDALPPPPPPAGSPPPPPRPAPPLHLLRPPQHQFHPFGGMMPHPPFPAKFDPSGAMPNFMPPEPPPGMITFP